VPPIPAPRRSGSFSTYRNGSGASGLCLKTPRLRGRAQPRIRVALVFRWRHSFREIVRQQWNFSPPGTTREIEDYQVELSEVTVLELVIVPDKTRGAAARASLKSLRFA
jgi:hypothetical protein